MRIKRTGAIELAPLDESTAFIAHKPRSPREVALSHFRQSVAKPFSCKDSAVEESLLLIAAADPQYFKGVVRLGGQGAITPISYQQIIEIACQVGRDRALWNSLAAWVDHKIATAAMGSPSS
ncbi:UNVERIFIED_ORG: hypothetical protein GGI63_003824 [Rhizobium esperanzae]|nr:hypothetical protein RHECNPAF_122100145 [Rhizobium etli CNPAF512]